MHWFFYHLFCPQAFSPEKAWLLSSYSDTFKPKSTFTTERDGGEKFCCHHLKGSITLQQEERRLRSVKLDCWQFYARVWGSSQTWFELSVQIPESIQFSFSNCIFTLVWFWTDVFLCKRKRSLNHWIWLWGLMQIQKVNLIQRLSPSAFLLNMLIKSSCSPCEFILGIAFFGDLSPN